MRKYPFLRRNLSYIQRRKNISFRISHNNSRSVDWFGRSISLVSLVTSLITLYYVNIDSRYLAYVVYPPLILDRFGNKEISIRTQTINIENAGNRSISIQSLFYIMTCGIIDSWDHQSLLTIRSETRARVKNNESTWWIFYPSDFKPFVVKPYEIDIRNYIFERKFDLTLIHLPNCKVDNPELNVYLVVESHSATYGRGIVRQLIGNIGTNPIGEGEKFSQVISRLGGKSLIIGKWWPFY